jgi:hypothetical protein
MTTLARLAPDEEPGCAGGEARGGGGLAMTEQDRRHLAQADQHIAECKGHVARQEELIQRIRMRGQPTEWAEQTLDLLKGALGDFEKHRETPSSSDDGRAHPQARADRAEIRYWGTV